MGNFNAGAGEGSGSRFNLACPPFIGLSQATSQGKPGKKHGDLLVYIKPPRFCSHVSKTHFERA